MNVQVRYFHISHKDSFCLRGKSKLGIGLFIHELLRHRFDFWGIQNINITMHAIKFLWKLQFLV